ncbi:hypothetical protein Tco_0467691 [Tanacetum coccineum]
MRKPNAPFVAFKNNQTHPAGGRGGVGRDAGGCGGGVVMVLVTWGWVRWSQLWDGDGVKVRWSCGGDDDMVARGGEWWSRSGRSIEDLSFYIFWVRQSLAEKVAGGGGGGRNNSPEKMEGMEEEDDVCAALSNEYDFIQARLNADKILAEKLQEEEREMYTIEQRAKFLHDTIAAQRRFLAQQRSETIKNKPPSRNQLRNQMMTYLKHVGGKKHSDLKTKGF